MTPASSTARPVLAKLGPRILSALVLLQVFLFVASVVTVLARDPDRILPPDELSYYLQGRAFFDSPNPLLLRHSNRPVFTLPAIAALKAVGADFTPARASLLTSLFYQAMLLVAIALLFSALDAPAFLALALVSIVWGMPEFYAYATSLLGEVPLAAWAALTLACFARLYAGERSPYWWGFSGLVFGAGAITKVNYLQVAAVAAASFLGAVWWKKRAEGKRWDVRSLLHRVEIRAFVLGWAPAFLGLCPAHAASLFRWLFQANQVLGYWGVQEPSLARSIFWLPAWLFEALPTVTASLFLVAVGVALAAGRERRALWKARLASPLFPVACFCAIYAGVTSFMKLRDVRTTLFLVPLVVGTLLAAAERASRRSAPARATLMSSCLAIAIVGVLRLCTVTGIVPRAGLEWTSRVVEGAIAPVPVPQPEPRPTYRDLGVERALRALAASCGPACRRERVGVFVPHTGYVYGDHTITGFLAVERALGHELGYLDGIDLAVLPGTFSHGFITTPGGIPSAFFRARYLLVVKDYLVRNLQDPTGEIYLATTTKALSSGDPDFLDGLTEVTRFVNGEGRTVMLFERERFPRPHAFAQVVATYAAADPLNPWNTFYLAAAAQADPSVTEPRRQLEEMARPGFLAGVRFPWGDEQRRAWAAEVLARPDANALSAILRSPETTARTF